MKTFDTPGDRWGDSNLKMVTDDEIRHAIDLARENGMKVILKPVVNPDDNVWRAEIKFSKPAADDDQTGPESTSSFRRILARKNRLRQNKLKISKSGIAGGKTIRPSFFITPSLRKKSTFLFIAWAAK